MFDHYDEDKLREIVNTHKRVNQEVKRRNANKRKCKLFSLCIFFDGMSDDNHFHDSHGLVAEIFLRHRHNYIQGICSSQKWRSLSTAVRGQACWICMFSMRSADERKAALNEFNGMYPMKVVERFLEEATRERFCFLYVNLLAPTREEAFFKNFEYRLLP